MREFSLIYAHNNGGIGYDGALPWPRVAADMRHFAETTMGSTVIMGKNTWNSIDPKHRPLAGRINIIVSSSAAFVDGLRRHNSIKLASSIEEAFDMAPSNREIFIIGGGIVYKYVLEKYGDYCKCIRETRIAGEYQADVHFDPFEYVDKKDFVFSLSMPVMNIDVSFMTWIRTVSNIENERMYLASLARVLEKGVLSDNRTGIRTLTTFAEVLRFRVRKLGMGQYTFPAPTTKRLFIRGVFEELRFFLRGQTNAKALSDRGVKIWDGNTRREYLDSIGLSHYAEGELGPAYGWQWNHWGASYPSTEGGIDQLAECVRLLREEPTSRRIILSAWNVGDLPKMCLPPCHMMYTFVVINGVLSVSMKQRSGDMFLGVPFNIASTALLLIYMAELASLDVGEICIVIDNAHVYENHIEAAETQLSRVPVGEPVLTIKKKIDTLQDARDLEWNDIEIIGYKPSGAISAEMIV